MIGQLRGEVTAKNERTIILNVGGVGYLVYLTADTLAKIKLKQPLTLHTHLAVRENALELFGFTEIEELNYFELLLTVPSVGPKSALAILSLATPTTLRRAITTENTDYLTRVSGIGKKSAEKIVLTLKDKLLPMRADGTDASDGKLQIEAEATEALKALGYTLAEAREALKHIPPNVGSTSDKVRAALKTLAK